VGAGSAGRRAYQFKADQASRAAMDKLANALGKELPLPDILVNNGGSIKRGAFQDVTDADWDEIMEINLNSIFRLSQAVVRQWLAQKRRGKIIHTASMMSFQGGIRIGSYPAAKSGLAGLTRMMANELASQGINVNAIAPGYMATDNTAALQADADIAELGPFLEQRPAQSVRHRRLHGRGTRRRATRLFDTHFVGTLAYHRKHPICERNTSVPS
jgi:2-deoxy-D-gluconate 3-dehydrogenase